MGYLQSRDDRQNLVHEWCVSAFGDDHAKSLEQRGIRLVEEAIELGQACGCDPEMIHRLVDHIYAKPPGGIVQEMGGVGVTLLALGAAADVSADSAEHMEVVRVRSMPLEHFAARNATKNAAGFNVLGPRRDYKLLYDSIRRALGYVENGTGQDLHICQDDATNAWVVSAGGATFIGESLDEQIIALGEAYKGSDG